MGQLTPLCPTAGVLTPKLDPHGKAGGLTPTLDPHGKNGHLAIIKASASGPPKLVSP